MESWDDKTSKRKWLSRKRRITERYPRRSVGGKTFYTRDTL